MRSPCRGRTATPFSSMVMLSGVQVVDSPEDLAHPCLCRRPSYRLCLKVRAVSPHTVCHCIRPLVQATSCSRMSLAWLPHVTCSSYTFVTVSGRVAPTTAMYTWYEHCSRCLDVWNLFAGDWQASESDLRGEEARGGGGAGAAGQDEDPLTATERMVLHLSRSSPQPVYSTRAVSGLGVCQAGIGGVGSIEDWRVIYRWMERMRLMNHEFLCVCTCSHPQKATRGRSVA